MWEFLENSVRFSIIKFYLALLSAKSRQRPLVWLASEWMESAGKLLLLLDSLGEKSKISLRWPDIF